MFRKKLVDFVLFLPRVSWQYNTAVNDLMFSSSGLGMITNPVSIWSSRILGVTSGVLGLQVNYPNFVQALACKDPYCLIISAAGIWCDYTTITGSFTRGANVSGMLATSGSMHARGIVELCKEKRLPFIKSCH